MEEQAKITGLPVDLTREEYVTFYSLLNRAGGMKRMQLLASISMLLLGCVMLGMVIYIDYTQQVIDWLSLVMGILSVAAGACGCFLLPLRLRRRAARSYDLTEAGGHSFYGLLCLGTDRIEKLQPDLTTAILFSEATIYIEHPAMIVVGCNQKRAIVLPARCMTPEAAAAVRQAADQMPRVRRFYYGRIVPQSQPVTEPVLPPITVLWEQSFCYTPEEYISCFKNAVFRGYWQRLPFFGVLSVMAGLAFGWNENSIWPCVLIFLVSLGLLTLLGLVLPLQRARNIDPETTFREMTVRLTDRGLQMLSGGREEIIPWTIVRHVIDREDAVEIQWQQQMIRIPKRCIPDFAAFSAVIDRCHPDRSPKNREQ